MKHLVVIDGHHLMYRAFYAIPKTLKTKNGELTNAVYGVASMLISMLKMEEPDAMVFCFDKGEDTFRHQENATYKEGRAETPDEFYTQIPRIMEMIDAFGIKYVSDGKYEADDFLGAYACAAEKQGMRVTIVTGDRDAFQLATKNVHVSIPHKGYMQPEYLGPEQILAKYGVRPDQIASYKGLIGDASDNLPGVQGIGPKTAAVLLQKYDTLKGVYEHLEDIKPTIRAKLEKDKDKAFFCEHMATLVCDLPLPESLEALQLQGKPYESVKEFFESLQFNTLQKRFEAVVKSPYGQGKFLQPEIKAAAVTPLKKDQLSLF